MHLCGRCLPRDCLLGMVVEKYEASVGCQTKAYVWGSTKTMLVPSQFATTISDAGTAQREVAMAIGIPPSLMELVSLGEPVAEGQWLARVMAVAEGATAKVRAPWRQSEQGLSCLAYLEAFALMARSEAFASQALLFDRSMSVEFIRDVLAEAVPALCPNIQINEQIAAFRAKVAENGLEDLFKKMAAIQHGLFGIKLDKVRLDEPSLKPSFKNTPGSILEEELL